MKVDFEKMRIATPAMVSKSEEQAINQVLEAGDRYGYGNMLSWLATAWEKKHPGMFTGKHPRGISAYPVDWIKE
jgi:hypothetical protein